MEGLGIEVGKTNFASGYAAFRMPTQYHLCRCCGVPWSFVLRIVVWTAYAVLAFAFEHGFNDEGKDVVSPLGFENPGFEE